MRHRGMVCLMMVVALPAALLALTSAYSVEPVQQSWSGKAHWVLGVSQIITCNFDSLEYVELFAGDACAMGMLA